ncbi:DUF1700 domain-containing protein [Alkalicella caledoniensis]|uniref:DUF1700 domain-containing protein n=1 Tax=Alkalicella caledoniensis TaxID=2731377 RepID=A0A7G9W5D5_ALKCA|nr:DUF1700 domain-containing protein [Alkalicella caledoniensis]QNO13897.1 DUF1700 domain-containing protein [Alkalicella caledoniensis]
MNKNQFLSRLRDNLRGVDGDSLKEIMYDYEEHFTIGLENGKTEEEISASLGDPEAIAAQYKYENAVKTAETNRRPVNLLKAILAGVGLGFFNLVFVLGIYIGIVASIFAFFVSSIAIAFAGTVLIIQSFLPFTIGLVTVPFILEGLLPKAALFFFGLGTTALGLLMTVIFVKIGQGVYNLTLKYLQANISIIKKAGEFNEV